MTRLLVSMLAVAALAACGGGGGSAPAPPPPPPATPSPTPVAGATPTPLPTATPTAKPTASPTPTPTPAPTPSPTPSPTPAPVPWTASQHHDYVAIGYGGNVPQYVNIYSPGRNVPSATITYNACCIEGLAFDAAGNLLMATSGGGATGAVYYYAPGAPSAPFKTLPAHGGFSLALSSQNDVAIGGYNSGNTVAVYPGGAANAIYQVPGQPAFNALAFSPSGELAVPQSDGTVQTFAHGSATPNRTLPLDLRIGGTNFGVVAYDGAGNLAVGGPTSSTVGVYAPGAATPSYTIGGFGNVQALAFDSANRLLVGQSSSVDIFAPGSTTRVKTLNAAVQALAVDADGDIATAGWVSASMVFQANGNVVTINGLFQATAVAISP